MSLTNTLESDHRFVRLALEQSRYAYVEIDDVPTDARREFAAQVYGLCLKFCRREFSWQDWASEGCYLGADAHRAWRLMLVTLRAYRVPHERCAGDGTTRSLRLSADTWWWVLRELSWACCECGEWFMHSPSHKAPKLPMGCADVVCEVCA